MCWGEGVNRIMRLQYCEATKQELVAVNELLFCLRLFDYLDGSRGCDSIHISNPNHLRVDPPPIHKSTFLHTGSGRFLCPCVRRGGE